MGKGKLSQRYRGLGLQEWKMHLSLDCSRLLPRQRRQIEVSVPAVHCSIVKPGGRERSSHTASARDCVGTGRSGQDRSSCAWLLAATRTCGSRLARTGHFGSRAASTIKREGKDRRMRCDSQLYGKPSHVASLVKVRASLRTRSSSRRRRSSSVWLILMRPPCPARLTPPWL